MKKTLVFIALGLALIGGTVAVSHYFLNASEVAAQPRD